MCSLNLSFTQVLHAQMQLPSYETIYEIQVMITDGPITIDNFPDLKNLGFFKTYTVARGPEEPYSPLRVCLGPFLGQETAELVLKIVQEKGYDEAFIYTDEQKLHEKDGKELAYSIQVGAFRNLNLRKFQNLANMPAHGMYIAYENGLFKILSGLYNPDEEEYLRNTVLPYYRSELGLDGFIRRIR